MVNGSEAALRPDSVAVEFDDERLVANAGLMLVATLSTRLGIERLVDRVVDLGKRAGAARPGRKVLSLVHAFAAGANSIDDTDVLRAGGTEAILGHRAMAPSTLGTFLRSFSFGHVRQARPGAGGGDQARLGGRGRPRLEAPGDRPRQLRRRGPRLREAGRRRRLHRPARLPPAPRHPRRHGRGPARPPAQGPRGVRARRASLRLRAPRPGPARRSGGGDPRPRRLRLLLEQGDRLPRGEALALLDRGHHPQADRRADRADPRVRVAAGRRLPRVGDLRARRDHYAGRRLVVRRVYLHAQEAQTELFAYWRHFAFLTNRSEQMHLVDREHRQHAEVELAIRDLKDQALRHFPSGSFAANAAWTVIACLAHNLGRWVGPLGLEETSWRAARTIRRWLYAIPGRLTRTARRFTLHLPARWPWLRHFVEALTRIRALAAAV